TWVPRLAPGSIAAGGHGLIRSAHALRALGDTDSDARRHELSQGLAYWAARYQELPGPPVPIGRLGADEALSTLPYLPDDASEEGHIAQRVGQVALIADELEQAVASLEPPDNASVALVDLAVGGARAYRRNADSSAVALVHAVTMPMAMALTVPLLQPADRSAAFAYLWQALASLHVVFAPVRGLHAAGGPVPGGGPEEDALGSGAADLAPADEVIGRAVASGDEHAIKLAEASLRAYAVRPDPNLILASLDASERLAVR
ncbi:MAG: hypothetical protein ACRDL8_15510, partial [Solirubrobacteraceae bacterium]